MYNSATKKTEDCFGYAHAEELLMVYLILLVIK